MFSNTASSIFSPAKLTPISALNGCTVHRESRRFYAPESTQRSIAMQVLQRIVWNGISKELGDLFRLTKPNGVAARAVIFSHEFGCEVTLQVTGLGLLRSRARAQRCVARRTKCSLPANSGRPRCLRRAGCRNPCRRSCRVFSRTICLSVRWSRVRLGDESRTDLRRSR